MRTMISIYFVIILLALGHGVKSQEAISEPGSGEAESYPPTVPPVDFIDDNGEISSLITAISDTMSNDTDEIGTDLGASPFEEEKVGNESTTLMVNSTNNGTTTEGLPTIFTDTTTVVDNETTTTMLSTVMPTTETTTENDTTSTTSPTTITSTTSTTEVPPTTFDETTTVSTKQTTTTSTKQTTTLSSTTTVAGKTDKAKGHVPSTQPDEDNVCEFVNPEFKCSREVVCFGEGEIDCETEESQVIMDKVSLSSSTPEDYSEYEISEGDSIGTFPPNLVGVGTPKKLSFYNRKSFTTDVQTEETSEISENKSSTDMEESSDAVKVNSSTEVGKVETMKKNCSVGMEGTDAANNCSTSTPDTTEDTSTLESSENSNPIAENKDSVQETTTISNDTAKEELNTTAALETTEQTTFQSTPMKILFSRRVASTTLGETAENAETTTTLSTQNSEDESNAKPEVPTEKKEKSRRKRSFSTNPAPTSEEKGKLAVEYLQRKYLINPTCRLSGDIQCLPLPTTSTCRGKTFCQAKRRKSETAETAQEKGLEVWVIVVSSICGCFGFMTLGLIAYLIIHSCKKLKVQPAHDVTPLNYITKQAENAETA